MKIFVSGQYGGDDAAEAARSVVTGLKQKLTFDDVEICGIDLQLRCNLYVSGNITTFPPPSGFSNIRLHLPKGYASCDIVMGEEIWRRGDSAIADFMTTTMSSAAHEISRKMGKRSMAFDACRLAALLLQVREDLPGVSQEPGTVSGDGLATGVSGSREPDPDLLSSTRRERK